MSIQDDNIAATQKLFEAFGDRNVDGMMEYINDDIVVEFYGPNTIPYAGHYEGQQGARRFFETVLASIQVNEFEPEEMLADGDKVIVTGHLNLTTNAGGQPIDSYFVQVITMRDGKWSRFRDFMDTAAAQAAFSDS